MSNSIYSTETSGEAEATIEKAIACLNSGGVIIFPTETVYGIAAKAGTAGVERIYEIKDRPRDKPFAVHMPNAESADRYYDASEYPQVKRLIDKTMPGPITVVVEVSDSVIQAKVELLGLKVEYTGHIYSDNHVGLRCPADEIASAIFKGVDGAVMATSANPSGEADLTTAQAAGAVLGDQVDLVVDGGPAYYNFASTVVKIGSGGMEILREGVVSRKDIEKLMQKTVLFICTGNTCRSPMAEAIGRHEIASRGIADAKVISAGMFAHGGGPMAAEAVGVLSDKGIAVQPHRAKQVTEEALTEADVIYCMTRSHKEMLVQHMPQFSGKIYTLGGDEDVDDPIGGSGEVYFRCANQIQSLIKTRFNELSW